MLRSAGQRGTRCGRPRRAHQARLAAGSEGFALLLCDVGLPEGDGCDLMREFRQRYGMKGVAMTAYASDAERARCLASGFSRFRAKPFRLDELWAAVAGVAGRSEKPPGHTQSVPGVYWARPGVRIPPSVAATAAAGC